MITSLAASAAWLQTQRRRVFQRDHVRMAARGGPTRIAKHPQHPVGYESSSEIPRIAGMAELADAADSKADTIYLVSLSK
jgi:hypothetical protein